MHGEHHSPEDDADIRGMAAAVLARAGSRMQAYWQIIFKKIALGGPASAEERQVLEATAKQLRITTPLPVTAESAVAEPTSFFARLMQQHDHDLPRSGKLRAAYEDARLAYPADPMKQHLTYMLTKGAIGHEDHRFSRKGWE